MSKHSPGPWGQEAVPASDPYNIRRISDADGTTVAYVRYPADMKWDEALANAALIKAAPELLDALKTLVANGGIGPEDMFERARVAIAKAKGAE